ncbi:MAG: hypothetical protein HY744_22765 [Deltaproteobacteria bacterium]|nr:hypothetical protein [Deltaproteobacteria bacterium]
MWPTIVVIGALLALSVLVNLRTSRPDGSLLRGVHPYRRLMPFVMRTRGESVVYFDLAVDAEPLCAYLERARERFEVDVTHCIVAAAAAALFETPEMNCFVAGRRLYRRSGRFVSFSMKRKALDKRAKIAVVKLELRPEETFRELCARIGDAIGVERSDARTHADREYALFNLVPRPLLAAAVALFRWLDYHGLLPGSFIRDDAMYTSAFIANLGSLKMGAGYHHLYEWGNCPLFVMAGQIEERAVVAHAAVAVRRVLPLRFSYNERIDDGLTARAGLETLRRVLEHPGEHLGCLADDGSDARPLGEPLAISN